MTTNIAPQPKLQFFDANGAPLSGGKLYTYAAGTTTPLASYTNYGGGTANANPVILDSRGEASVWLGTGMYKMVLKTSVDVEVWTVDNLNGADAATVAATLATLAASGGADLIGWSSGVSSPITQTVQDKLRQMINVKDYGAVGDGTTDDTAAIQAAIDEFQNAGNGGIVYMPPGRYKITSNLTITWPHATSEDSGNEVALRGAGSGLTILLDYRTSVSTGGCVSYDFSGYTGAELNSRYLLTWIGGFSIIKMVNATTIAGDIIAPGTGTGLYMNCVISGTVWDLHIRGHEICVEAINCLGNAFRDLLLSQADIGLSLTEATPVTVGGGQSPPNAVVVDHCSINICRTAGVDILGGNVGIKGCSFSFDGINTPTGGGVRNKYQDVLCKQLTIDHCMFESNGGLADVVIDGTLTASTCSVLVSNSTFIRNYPTTSLNPTNNIAVVLGATSYCDFAAIGNGFRRYTGTAGSGTKNIEFLGLGYANVRSVMIGNTFYNSGDSPVPGGGAVSGALVATSLALQTPDGVYAPVISPVTGSNWIDIADAVTVIGGAAGGIIPNDNNSEFLGYPASGTARHWAGVFSREFFVGDTEVSIITGSGAPSGGDGKPIGTLYLNTAGGASTTLYVKTGASTYTAK